MQLPQEVLKMQEQLELEIIFHYLVKHNLYFPKN